MDKQQKKEALKKFNAAARSRETEARQIRKDIQGSSGMTRWALWNDKRDFGYNTRHVLLAYAFVRGMPYKAAEPNCAEDNVPSRVEIAGWLKAITDLDVAADEISAWLGAQPVAAPAPVVQMPVPAEKPGFFGQAVTGLKRLFG